ncbi:MAG: helix-turn-helix transcriptional regulator [Oscillospiraceae bacterium]|nr:helix-turn-helix transcriptional regulator [Oscillospiraceae bacterium]
MITYDPLWETMKKKKISTYTLIKEHAFSKGTLDALKHNRNITMATLNDICNLLGCTPADIIKYTPDE